MNLMPQETGFTINLDGKKLHFSPDTQGLIIGGKEYVSGADGVLVYDKTVDLSASEVTCQFSSNTSTLIPTLRILGIPYHPYFDQRDVIESQNDITFYWKPSKLATFYNRFSTDRVPLEKRETVIRQAVDFLIRAAGGGENFLPAEDLKWLKEPCKLLGVYQGFPIFDANFGMPKLLCRLGIHIGEESIMVSTPLDRYAPDVEELARILEGKAGLSGTRKKNRVKFPKDERVLRELGLV